MTDSNSPLQYQPTPVGNAKAYEEILRTSIIHIGEEYQSPPEIIWVDDSVIATLGNFSASTGKAKSRIGYKSVLHMVEMQPDGMGLIGDEVKIFDGNENDQVTIEGPKMYKRNGEISS